MKKNNMVAMILAGGRGSRLYALTKKIAKPVVAYGGKYRIIDFALSNCANSDITKVGVLVQYESILLSSYTAHSDVWGLNTTDGGVFVLAPREKEQTGFEIYQGTADAISRNLDFLDQEDAQQVLILSGDHIYKMDYQQMLNKHLKSGADATIAVIQVPLAEASRFGIMNCDENDVIVEFEEKPKKPKSDLASMGIYIFNYKTLKKYLKEDMKNDKSSHDFGKDIIPTYLQDGRKLQAYRFKGYWKDVGTIDSLWQANMDLLQDNELDLFDPEWKIYTHDVIAAPQCIGEKAIIDNALITQGTIIDGEVHRSVIFTGAEVCEEAVVEDSVVMNDAIVGKGAVIKRCLVQEGVKIPDGARFEGKDEILLVSFELLNKGGK